MLALKDNRKIKILFYIFVLLSLSTINFFKLDNTINKQTFFSINKIEFINEKIYLLIFALQNFLKNLIFQK